MKGIKWYEPVIIASALFTIFLSTVGLFLKIKRTVEDYGGQITIMFEESNDNKSAKDCH